MKFITESEKERILKLHQEARYKNLIKENQPLTSDEMGTNEIPSSTTTTTATKPSNPSNVSGAASSLANAAKSIQWGPTEFIQKGMRNNDKVRGLQRLMGLRGRKGQSLVTGYFGPITDGGLSNNFSDIYKSGQKVDKKLYDVIIDRLASNTTYADGSGLQQGGAREDLGGTPQSIAKS